MLLSLLLIVCIMFDCWDLKIFVMVCMCLVILFWDFKSWVRWDFSLWICLVVVRLVLVCLVIFFFVLSISYISIVSRNRLLVIVVVKMVIGWLLNLNRILFMK